MEKILSARGLRKRFGKTDAVDDVSFELERGRAYGLIGPNGAGKTTTLQMLLGLYPPDSGRVEVFGLNPVREREAVEIRKRVGYVPERHFIYRDMTCAQVLTFAGGIYPTWNAEACKRAVDLLSLPLKSRVKHLSRGHLAKLSLVIALAPRPELLILDEPTSGLDPIIRREFLDAIVGMIQEEGRTVLFSSHVMSDVERVAETVLLMNEGRLVETADMDALRRRFVRVSFVFDEPPPPDAGIPEARSVAKGAREWTAVFDNRGPEEIAAAAVRIGARNHVPVAMTLEEIFVETLGRAAGKGRRE